MGVLAFPKAPASQFAEPKAAASASAGAASETAAKSDDKDRIISAIDGYLVDLTDFVEQHPGTKKKLLAKREQLGVDISPNFLDHFGHTVRTFRAAAKEFEKRGGVKPYT